MSSANNEINKNKPLTNLFLKLLILQIENIDKFTVQKYFFIAKSYLPFLEANHVLYKFGPCSRQIQDGLYELNRQDSISMKDKGLIYNINTSKLLIEIEEFKNEIPEIVEKMNLVITILKYIGSEIETFPEKELFTTILYFIREEEIFTLDRLYRAIIFEKKRKFGKIDFLRSIQFLKKFCLIEVSGDNITLIDEPFKRISYKLLRYSNKVVKFMARNSQKIMNADKEFLIRNSDDFKKLYLKFKNSLSSCVGNGLNKEIED